MYERTNIGTPWGGICRGDRGIVPQWLVETIFSLNFSSIFLQFFPNLYIYPPHWFSPKIPPWAHLYISVCVRRPFRCVESVITNGCLCIKSWASILNSDGFVFVRKRMGLRYTVNCPISTESRNRKASNGRLAASQSRIYNRRTPDQCRSDQSQERVDNYR